MAEATLRRSTRSTTNSKASREEQEVPSASSGAPSSKAKGAQASNRAKAEASVSKASESAPKSKQPKGKRKSKTDQPVAVSNDSGESGSKQAKRPKTSEAPREPAKRKRAPKSEGSDVGRSTSSASVKQEEAPDSQILPLNVDTKGIGTTQHEQHAFDDNDWWVGAHMSVAKGVENSIIAARAYGAQAFALFLKPKMNWTYKPLDQMNIDRFRAWLPAQGYHGRRCLPHGSYLINLGNPEREKRAKSLDSLVDDLRRCVQLGIEVYNFHPGSGVGECSKSEACTFIAQGINAAHEQLAREELESPVVLLENMAGQGKQVGSTFEELRDIIDGVKDKSKIGVCIDTAHAFAAGYDIRTLKGYLETMQELDRTVGMKYVRGVHLNDSKSELGSKADRHENIGGGHIGLVPFWCIMNDERFKHMPLTLETPASSWRVWQGEIRCLYALQGLARDDFAAWHAIRDDLAALRAIPKEMEKGNSLAEGALAAVRAAEGKVPKVKRPRVKKEDKGESSGAPEGKDGETGKAKKAGKGKQRGRSKAAAAEAVKKEASVGETGMAEQE